MPHVLEEDASPSGEQVIDLFVIGSRSGSFRAARGATSAGAHSGRHIQLGKLGLRAVEITEPVSPQLHVKALATQAQHFRRRSTIVLREDVGGRLTFDVFSRAHVEILP